MKGRIIEPVKGGRYGLGDWFTHLPFLVTALSRTRPRTVLEMGTGDYSTIMLHSYAQGDPSIRITSLENDDQPGWYDRLQWMHCGNHEFVRVEGYDDLTPWDRPWDLVFIDYDPEVRRGHAVEFFAGRAGIVLLHDCNYEGRYASQLELYKYVVHDRRHRLFTAMASNHVNVEGWFDE